MKRLKKGSLYRITFLDHCVGDEETLVTCEICGWVVSETEKRLTITTWWVQEEEYREGNQELVNVVKSAIKDLVELS